MNISCSTVLAWMNDYYTYLTKDLKITQLITDDEMIRVERIEVDEMHHKYLVTIKTEQGYEIDKIIIWIWKVIDKDTNKIIAFYVGSRQTRSLYTIFNKIRHKLPNLKTVYTDGWDSYKKYFSKYRFPNVTLIQSKANTHLVESSNCQQRHWLTEFIRKTISVTRSLVNLKNLLFMFYYFRTNGNGKRFGMNL